MHLTPKFIIKIHLNEEIKLWKFSGKGRGVDGAGRGVQARPQENSLDTVFLSSTFFTVNRGGPMVLLQRRQYFSKDPERVQYFPGGGVQLFPWGGGGVQMLISIETHMTCDFPGVWTPYPHSGSAHDLVIYFLGGISLQSIFTVKVGHL